MPRKYLVLLACSLSVLLVDQWTKYLVLSELTSALDGATTFAGRVKQMYSAAPVSAFGGHHYRAKRTVTVSESFFRLRYAENPGAAWGLFRDVSPDLRGPFFHFVSLAAVALIAFYFFKLSGTDPSERWALWGLPLVLGGALGNYCDRLGRGFVIDFLEAHWYDRIAWPSFNVADAGISIGVCMLIIDSFVRRESPTKVA